MHCLLNFALESNKISIKSKLKLVTKLGNRWRKNAILDECKKFSFQIAILKPIFKEKTSKPHSE